MDETRGTSRRKLRGAVLFARLRHVSRAVAGATKKDTTMLVNSPRSQAIASLADSKVEPVPPGIPEPDKIFGIDVFGYAQMEARLPKDVCKSLKKTIETGTPLDPKVADVVAAAMKDWAMSKGATESGQMMPASS